MTYHYMTLSHPIYGDTDYIVRVTETETSVFQKTPENPDYQAFLEWEAAGNTATEWRPA